MERKHLYRTDTTWIGDLGSGTSGYREYERAHQTIAAGRPPIDGSSDPAFYGDPKRWNPELLLVASLSQCHMLWYLSLCATSGVIVTDYSDSATGVMVETADGAGFFEEVTLHPHVTVAAEDMKDEAARLHERAGAHCFIAASVKFPVRHVPRISVESPRRGEGSHDG